MNRRIGVFACSHMLQELGNHDLIVTPFEDAFDTPIVALLFVFDDLIREGLRFITTLIEIDAPQRQLGNDLFDCPTSSVSERSSAHWTIMKSGMTRVAENMTFFTLENRCRSRYFEAHWAL